MISSYLWRKLVCIRSMNMRKQFYINNWSIFWLTVARSQILIFNPYFPSIVKKLYRKLLLIELSSFKLYGEKIHSPRITNNMSIKSKKSSWKMDILKCLAWEERLDRSWRKINMKLYANFMKKWCFIEGRKKIKIGVKEVLKIY